MKLELLGQLLDRVAAVAQDPLVAVDVGDGAAAHAVLTKPLSSVTLPVSFISLETS